MSITYNIAVVFGVVLFDTSELVEVYGQLREKRLARRGDKEKNSDFGLNQNPTY